MRAYLGFILNLTAPCGLIMIWFALFVVYRLPGVNIYDRRIDDISRNVIGLGLLLMVSGVPGYLIGGWPVIIRRRMVLLLAPLVPFALVMIYLIMGFLLSFLAPMITVIIPVIVIPFYVVSAIDAFKLIGTSAQDNLP
jgi:hypothetical protein